MIQSVYKIVIAVAALNVAATLALSGNTENVQVARAFDDFDLEVREPAFDILQTRDFDDEFDLDARDPRFGKGFKGFLKKFRKGGSAPPSEGGESRREIDDFDLEARDFDDELELEARDPRFGKGFKGIFKKFRKGGSPPPSEGGESRREIDDFDLEARDLDDEFELEARDPRFGKGFKGIFKKFRKGGSPPSSEGAESRREIDDLDLEARDFDDEFNLEARDPRFGKGFKGIFKKFRKGGSPPSSEGGESRREIDDLDLEARDPRFGKGFKGLFKKFRKGGSAPSSEGGESRREFDGFDHSPEARDFDEIEELE